MGSKGKTNKQKESIEAKYKLDEMIGEGGNATITGNGKIDALEDDCYAFDVVDGGKLKIENGEISGNVSAVYVLKGSAEIKGGEFSIKQLDPYGKGTAFTLNCEDDAYKDKSASIVVTGGYKERAKEISISSDDLVHLYDLYKDKLSSQLYSDISKDFAPAKAGRILKENRGQFISMNIISKCLIMKSIVDAAAPRLDNTFYLHSLDEKSKEMKKYISNILPPKIKLIHQSATGFFEKVIWENKEE